MPDEKVYHYRTDTHQFGFRANSDMTDTIKNLAAERRRSYSNTIRLLLNLGLQSYEINKKAGIVTSSQSQQDKHRREAEAQARAARKQKNVTDVTQTATALLFGTDTDS